MNRGIQHAPCEKHLYDVDRHHRIDGDSGHQVRLVAGLLPCHSVGLAALVLYGWTSYPLLFVGISLFPITVFMLAGRIINVVFNIGDMGLQNKGYTATAPKIWHRYQKLLLLVKSQEKARTFTCESLTLLAHQKPIR
ncbi:hypothetical protein ACK39A_11105 [Aeromonas veronii]|uniref:hypothetical protein n=1 Tax=Aeromonas sp. DNRA1 TaxID=2729335 RepID=UPI0014591C43|nr:hypothetical protein [Aeromonas sp. DNRA1]NME02863.1 hypothetical protein [Aeromonas sp. DNRA1]HDX8358203.1 hypothetical protein [Aeromonas hydrophila]